MSSFLDKPLPELLERGGRCSPSSRFCKQNDRKERRKQRMRQYLDLLDRVLKTPVKPQMKHLEAISTAFVESFDSITLTEQGYMLSAMMMGTRRLKNSIDKAEREQKKTLLLKADFDAREVRGSLEGVIGKLEAYITPPTAADEEADLDEMLDTDDYEGLLSADERGGDMKRMRLYLLQNYYNIFSKMRESAKRAATTLNTLAQLQSAIAKDAKTRQDLWRAMNEYYLNHEWDDQKATLEYRIRQEMTDDDNRGMTKIQILDRELRRLTIDHTTDVYKRELKELNQSVVSEHPEPIKVLMKNRENIDEEDLSQYFCFFNSYKYISEAKETMVLMGSPTDYDLLFCNRAAQEYVETLLPVLKRYGGLNDKGHYGILKIVLQELGLVDEEKNNGLQMMEFVNAKIIADEGERLPRQDSITLMTGKLNKQIFARLGTEGIGKTKFKDDKEYARVKEVFWRCFTILNYYGLLDVKEVGYDSYLNDPHPFTRHNDPWEDVDSETKNRLTFLSFVLRGEGIRF